MKKFEFSDLKLIEVEEIYAVTYNDKILSLDGKTTFSKYAYAKNRLHNVLTSNYHQGHYWHKDKDNTFATEGGHMRNGGVMSGLDKIFKKLGKELTEELLDENVFVIQKIQ
jgi:hypothetical protein